MPRTNLRSQSARVPNEIVDSIVDWLAPDSAALGACGLVCSEWLPRSRYHLFSHVHLPCWRVRHFTQLVQSPACTFAPFVSCISIDGSPGPNSTFDCEVISVCRTLAECHMRVRADTIRLQNICWTAISFPDQKLIMQSLGRFGSIRRLELDQMVFHDLRAVVSIVGVFPRVNSVTAGRITFVKYKEHVLVSAAKVQMPCRLESLHLGGGDEVVVFLSCLASQSGMGLLGLRTLTVERVPGEDVAHVEQALKIVRHRLHNLRIGSPDGNRDKSGGGLVLEPGVFTSCPVPGIVLGLHPT